jgi:septal ring factor EnvC (AmiA/AmiB activator)
LAQAGIEESKMKAYAEQVRAVLARADVYKAELEAVITEVNVEKVKLESNMQAIQQWAKKVDVDITRYNAKLEEFKANIELNKAIAVVANSANDSEVRAWTASAEANIQYAKLEEESIRSKYEMTLEAQKGVASVAGTLAAGAMSAINANAAMEYTANEDI